MSEPIETDPQVARPRWLRGALYVSVGIGILYRLLTWTHDSPLWRDEGFLATQVLPRSWSDLFSPLGGGQSAPLAYLLLVKLATALWNEGELALRLPSLLAGIGTLLLAPSMFRRLLPLPFATLAVALVALSAPAVYFSAEFKQYETELFVTVGLFWLAFRHVDRPDRPSAVRLGLAGCLAVFLSLPAVFVLGSIGIAILCDAWRRRDRGGLVSVSICGVAWLVAIAANWMLLLRTYAASDFFKAFWAEGFMPLPPRSAHDLLWLPNAVQDLCRTLLGLEFKPARVLAALLAVTGVVPLARRSGAKGWIVLGTIALALLAAIAHRYPFKLRLQLFATPAWSAMVAAGIMLLWTRRLAATRAIGVAAAVLLLAAQLRTLLLAPYIKDAWSDLRWARGAALSAQRSGESVGIEDSAAAQLDYYLRREGPLPGGPIREFDLATIDWTRPPAGLLLIESDAALPPSAEVVARKGPVRLVRVNAPARE